MSAPNQSMTTSEPRFHVPVIPGDGVGPEVWHASRTVFDAAASSAGIEIRWEEILAGETALNELGEWLPEESLDAVRRAGVAIKGPLTTPVGGGFRSLNVAIRQALDLFACVRPIRHFAGVDSPVKNPEAVDVVIFRENTEDIYAGLEVAAGSPDEARLRDYVQSAFGWDLPDDGGIGLKPISRRRSQRLQRAAMDYALRNQRRRVTLVHKGTS